MYYICYVKQIDPKQQAKHAYIDKQTNKQINVVHFVGGHFGFNIFFSLSIIIIIITKVVDNNNHQII